MIYLADANVLSEPTKLLPNSKVAQWLTVHEADLVVDAIILGELYGGILALPVGKKRVRLEQWFDDVVQAIECVPWDAAVSRRWAKLVVQLRNKGHTMPVLDSMIAASALEHDLTLATRNVRNFRTSGVKLVNPFV